MRTSISIAALCACLGACSSDDPTPVDPNTAMHAPIDRFSDSAGTLFQRAGNPALPAANAAVDFDQGPFITRGLTADGATVRYYNFDVMPAAPAPIYVLFREGESSPVDGQLNIVDVVPGDEGYNDFWQVTKVTVPAGYTANTVTSLAEIRAEGFAMETTENLVNCPVVPDGSTANLRAGGEGAGLHQGWYRGEVVSYFTFEEAPLSTVQGSVPLSPIYVTFNINPGEDGGGPPSGFVTETGSDQTHNVIETVPGDPDYSPLWLVNIYDNAEFDSVSDLASAENATILASAAAQVNCPVVDPPGGN